MITIYQKPFGFHIKLDKWNADIIADIKAINWQSRKYIEAERVWEVDLSHKAAVDALKIRYGGRFVEQTEEEKIGEIPPMPKLTIDIPTRLPLREYQAEGVAYGMEKLHFINGDAPGLGKEQPLSSLIATPDGFVKMGNVKIGTSVFGADGNIYNVTGVFPQGKKDVYEITFNDGVVTHCGIDHLWKIRDANRRRRGNGWIIKPLSFMLKWGVLSKLDNKREKSGRKAALKWEIPMCDPVKYSEKDYLIHPYLLGIMLGDGSLGNKCICISIPDTEKEILDRITYLIPEYMKFTPNRSGACPNYSLAQKYAYKNNPFMKEIRELKLDVNGSKKFIPEIYLHGSVEQRIELLRGLMDSDGSAKKNRLTFHSKSKSLVDSVATLVRSLGGQAIIRIYDRTHHNKGIEYQLNIRIKICPFYLTRKIAQYNIKKENYCSRYIKSVVLKSNEECQCISVSAPDKLYLTDNYIVTHNTFQTITTIYALNAWPALIICPASLRRNWQAEWEKFVGIKAMILNDSVKKTWTTFYEMGMCKVFIVNYESLKKYFVLDIVKNEKGKFKLSNVKFNSNINIFESVAIDEIHKCFPYETLVNTNKGLFKIGDIVENNRNDLLVMSLNLSTNLLTYKPIINTWKNDIRHRKICNITHNEGILRATEDHKIYTASGRYKKVSEIKSGEILFVLQKEIHGSKTRQWNRKILQPQLCYKPNEHKLQGERDGSSKKRKNRNYLRVVRKEILYTCKQINTTQQRKAKKVLQSKLFCKIENEPAGNKRKSLFRRIKSKTEKRCTKSEKQSCSIKIKIRQNDIKQSYVKSGNKEKGYRKIKRENISFKRWKWTNDSSTIKTLGSVMFTKRSFRVSNNYRSGKKSIRISSVLLQSRYCFDFIKDCNRSGRIVSWNEKMEIFRRTKNRNIKCVRVESVEVQKQRNNGQLGRSFEKNQTVYDLEIADNNNYFADNILVSNCKDPTTMVSKLVRGICAKKKVVIGLTGTPIVNKPKDLVAQLLTIGQLEAVAGNYKHFMNRYCGGMAGAGATNLSELNYKLKTTCFFQRLKKDVLKDLPDKVHQIVYCDITTRDEYNKASTDLANYLKENKDKTDAEVAKSMRGEVMVKIGILKQISARGKMNEVSEYIEEIVDADEKVGVFLHHKEIANFVKEKFPSTLLYTGSQSDEEKNKAVHDFQKCKKCDIRFENHVNCDHEHVPSNNKIIALSTKAGGVGLTLTAASRMAVIELPWHPADCEQIESRFHRMSQKNSVQCTYFLGKDTIDEHIYDIIEKKRAIADTVLGVSDDRKFVDDFIKDFADGKIKL